MPYEIAVKSDDIMCTQAAREANEGLRDPINIKKKKRALQKFDTSKKTLNSHIVIMGEFKTLLGFLPLIGRQSVVFTLNYK